MGSEVLECFKVGAEILKGGAAIFAARVVYLGIDSWKQEFIGKRRIELAEDTLATFFEIKAAIAFIRSPLRGKQEGSTRQREPDEDPEHREILDRAFIAEERYNKKEEIFNKYNKLQYRFRATFGDETKDFFAKITKITNDIFSSSRLLGRTYWPSYEKQNITDEELKHMHKRENILMSGDPKEDEIVKKLEGIQKKLEETTESCFKSETSLNLFSYLKWKKSDSKK